MTRQRQQVLYRLLDRTGETIKTADRTTWVHFNSSESKYVVDVSLFEGESTVNVHMSPEGILVVDITRA